LGVFGEKLRQHRERRGLSLEAISSATKISPRMLSALEDEHFEQLPGGVFNKGFVRAYARVVGLDEDEALSDYLTALRESQIHSQTSPPNFRREARPIPQPEPPTREKEGGSFTRANEDSMRPDAITSQVEDRRTRSDRRLQSRRSADGQAENPPQKSQVGEFSHAVQPPPQPRAPESYAAPEENYPVQYSEEEPATPPASFLNLSAPAEDDYQLDPDARQTNSTSPVRWQNLAIPLILLTLVLALWALHRRNTAVSRQTAVSQTASSQSVTTQTDATQAAAPPESSETTARASSPPARVVTSSPAKPAPVPSPHSSTPPRTSTASPPIHSQPIAAKPKPLPTFTLVIRAAKTSWISITADGQPVAQETLIAPAHTSVRATQEIVVKTRNAGALSFTLNHLEIPPQGAEGEARTYSFDANGLRATFPSSTAVR
jgi:transcriptional regulator with XRE-family HTH domain